MLMAPRAAMRRRQRGFSMIEILISLVITAFGLLGLAGFASKATALSLDATQRARAAAFLADMSARIANDKTNAADYVDGVVHGAAVLDCSALAGEAARDLCEWNNLLAGSNDAAAGNNAAALGFRGCVTRPNPADPVFVITVAWGSMSAGVPPADACAQNVFGDDSQRRVIRSQVRVANLIL
jgi:type IV pilus assembly protein PilV